MSRSSANSTKIIPRPSNKKLKKLEKQKRKSSNYTPPSSDGSNISSQSEELNFNENNIDNKNLNDSNEQQTPIENAKKDYMSLSNVDEVNTPIIVDDIHKEETSTNKEAETNSDPTPSLNDNENINVSLEESTDLEMAEEPTLDLETPLVNVEDNTKEAVLELETPKANIKDTQANPEISNQVEATGEPVSAVATPIVTVEEISQQPATVEEPVYVVETLEEVKEAIVPETVENPGFVMETPEVNVEETAEEPEITHETNVQSEPKVFEQPEVSIKIEASEVPIVSSESEVSSQIEAQEEPVVSSEPEVAEEPVFDVETATESVILSETENGEEPVESTTLEYMEEPTSYPETPINEVEDTSNVVEVSSPIHAAQEPDSLSEPETVEEHISDSETHAEPIESTDFDAAPELVSEPETSIINVDEISAETESSSEPVTVEESSTGVQTPAKSIIPTHIDVEEESKFDLTTPAEPENAINTKDEELTIEKVTDIELQDSNHEDAILKNAVIQNEAAVNEPHALNDDTNTEVNHMSQEKSIQIDASSDTGPQAESSNDQISTNNDIIHTQETSEKEVDKQDDDLEIVESADDQIFKIKPDFLDFIHGDNPSVEKVPDINTSDNINILLNHRKYILKSIITEESTPFTSGILNSKLNADYDIAVNILKNGHIKFSNISNKHSLNLEYNLLELLHISLNHLPYLKVFLKSNYSTNALNDKVQGEMNPSVLILDTLSGSIWDFENIKGSFSQKTFFFKQNDILKKLQFTAEKDITLLPRSGCILFKNDKNQLILFNVYKNQITFLKHKHEKRSNGLFKKVLSYIESPRSDVVDFVVEDRFNEDTVTVLFSSDIIMYHIRKHNDLHDSKYHFDMNIEFSAIEKDDLIYNNILDKKAPVILLGLSKVYSHKKDFFYSLLVAKDISKLVYVNIRVSDKFEVLGYYDVNYFDQSSADYRGKLDVQTSYIEQQDFYTSFIVFENEIVLSQIPLAVNNNQMLFSDVIVYVEETTVLPGTVYQVEYENDKSTCLSYQTNLGGQYTFYQLHVKNQSNTVDDIDHNLEFLNFHIGNYVFNRVIDNDGELLSNKLDYQWLASDKKSFEDAFKNQVDKIIQSDEISVQQKIGLFENGLNIISVNINTWLTFLHVEFMKSLILTILEHLSTLKVLNVTGNNSLAAEQTVMSIFDDFNQQLLVSGQSDTKFDELLEFISKVIYEPLLCEIERQYRCQYFEQIMGSSFYNSLLFSTKVNDYLVDFISQIQTLNVNYSEKTLSGLLTVLNVLYYQNHMGINKKDTLVMSVHSILDTFKEQPKPKEIKMLKHLAIINKDWISMFKIYDYLSSTKQIEYSEYPSFFEVDENKKELLNSFLDLYLNKEYKTKLQNFFDIMGRLDNTFFIQEVYQELCSRERKDIVTEVLWAYETLINKDYKKAFKVLSEVDDNKAKTADDKTKYKDFSEFKESMMRLCEVLSSDEDL